MNTSFVLSNHSSVIWERLSSGKGSILSVRYLNTKHKKSRGDTPTTSYLSQISTAVSRSYFNYNGYIFGITVYFVLQLNFLLLTGKLIDNG